MDLNPCWRVCWNDSNGNYHTKPFNSEFDAIDFKRFLLTYKEGTKVYIARVL